ncbi:SPOR domain-containing protein [Erysipelotrichaceae bacterium Oil+RF-744-GAM-WT-6]|uniref:SPOR domain-containing protein n=1 Tax=Stecheria intestinalis TaxID=2606630 RepID=A0A7X2NSQ9_9FIRM|nr:SPOR domain-containing protein [Stecheria intestinalis]
MHKWWSNTLCPGAYLSSKFSYIAEQINEALSNDFSKASTLYVVQAGAFSSYRNAAKMKNQLRKAGFDGYIIKGNLYRVQVGSFKEYANAEALAARLRPKGFTAYLRKKDGSE